MARHRLIDWIADYRSQIEQMPVRAQVKPSDVKCGLPASLPTKPESLDDLMQDLQNIIVPGLTQVQHPMHYGWFPSNTSLSPALDSTCSANPGKAVQY
jgi:aromatic-L-amino-acid decarboxylase